MKLVLKKNVFLATYFLFDWLRERQRREGKQLTILYIIVVLIALAAWHIHELERENDQGWYGYGHDRYNDHENVVVAVNED